MKKLIGRPKTDRNIAVKIGLKVLPKYNEKLELLSERLLMSKSEALEYALENTRVPLQSHRCNSCGAVYRAKENHVQCNECRMTK